MGLNTGYIMAETKKTTGKRFDPSRPHGIVYGHINGKYEQDGVLFGANGVPLDEDTIEADERQLAQENRDAEAARQRELLNK